MVEIDQIYYTLQFYSCGVCFTHMGKKGVIYLYEKKNTRVYLLTRMSKSHSYD